MENTKISSSSSIGTIYFIYEHKYKKMNLNVFKIGYTIRKLEKRLNEYEKKYRLLYSFTTYQPEKIERTIINIFNIKYELYAGRERFKGNKEEMINILEKVKNYDRNKIDSPIYFNFTIDSFYNISLKNIMDKHLENTNDKNKEKLISSFDKDQMHLFLSIINIKQDSQEYIHYMLLHSKLSKPKKYRIDLLSYLSDLFENKFVSISRKFVKEYYSQNSDSNHSSSDSSSSDSDNEEYMEFLKYKKMMKKIKKKKQKRKKENSDSDSEDSSDKEKQKSKPIKEKKPIHLHPPSSDEE